MHRKSSPLDVWQYAHRNRQRLQHLQDANIDVDDVSTTDCGLAEAKRSSSGRPPGVQIEAATGSEVGIRDLG